MRGPMNGRARTKLATELDKEGQCFRKAVRRYRTREWARDMRRALGITLDFLAEETQVSAKTLYRAESREATGAIQIAELEALAEAMECKLVYAIVPAHGTVAEMAEKLREHPRKRRKQREKEAAEYMEWYEKEVEKIQRQRDPVGWELRKKGLGGQGSGTKDQGPESKGQGTEGQQAMVRPPGAQRLRDAVAGVMKEMGQEKEQAIRQKTAKMPWDQSTERMTPATIELLKLAKAEWEKGREQATGNREQEQGVGSRE